MPTDSGVIPPPALILFFFSAEFCVVRAAWGGSVFPAFSASVETPVALVRPPCGVPPKLKPFEGDLLPNRLRLSSPTLHNNRSTGPLPAEKVRGTDREEAGGREGGRRREGERGRERGEGWARHG